MMKKILLLLMVAACCLPWVSRAQSFNYTCTFEDDADTAGWLFSNGSNAWIIDSAVASTGSRSMYISNGGGAHSYTTSATSFSYAYREFDLTLGSYYLSFDWLAYGESSYDFIRVYLVPNSIAIPNGVAPDGSTASYNQYTSTPANWIALDGNHGFNLVSSWQNYSYEFDLATSDTFKLVFMWCNDGSAGSLPPGAIDNIVFAQPTCPRPMNFSLDNLTTTAFDLYWHENGTSSEWVVEFDTVGQVFGQGDRQTVYDTFYSFYNLTPNTTYNIYVASVCGGVDTSIWARYSVTTPCDYLTSVPYYEDFENAAAGSSTSSAFLNCWYRNNNATTYFGIPFIDNSTDYSHSGGTHGLYWYCSNSGGAYGDYQCLVLPGFDPDSIALSALQLSFWAKSSSSSYQPVFYVGVMSNPNDVATFHPVDTIRVSGTDWAKYVAPLAGCADSCNFIAIMATRGASYWYAYVDEFTVELAPACRVSTNLEVASVAGTSAYLTWDLLGRNAMPSDFLVRVYNNDDSTSTHPVDYTTTEQNFFLSGLEPSTCYTVHVNSLCESDTAIGDTIRFNTSSLPCSLMDASTVDTIIFSNGTSGTSGCLAYSSWGNTAFQTIYTASELAAAGLQAGPVIGLDFGFTPSTTYTKEFSIYIANSSTTAITSGTLASPAGHQLVYGPAVHPVNTSGWQHYDFVEPFIWDGSSSIMITTLMNQYGGSHTSSSGLTGYCTTASNKAAYRYQDSSPFSAANINTGSAGSSYSYRPSIHFYTGACLERATCVAPNVVVTRNVVDTVSLLWAAGLSENSWDIAYRLESDSVWTIEATGVTETSYVINNLLPMSDYLIRVTPDCGGDSVYAELSLTTPCVPVVALPFTEDFENFAASSSVGSPITNCWHRGTNYTSANYPYINTSNGLSGTRSMYFYAPGSSYHAYLVLPDMAASVDSLQVSFAMRYSTAGYGLKVGVMTDPSDFSTFTEVESVTLRSANNWEMFEIPFSSYTGQDGYITLAAVGTNSYCYVDNVEVDYIPTCPRPRNVTATSLTQNTATIHWADSLHQEFEIEYGPSGFAHGTGSLTNSSVDSVTIYALRHSTRYDVYVRAVCSAGDTSAWSFVSSFVTDCGTIDTLPWHDDFSAWGIGTGARPSCWTSGGYSSYPYIINVTDADGSVLRQTYNLYSYTSNPTYFSLPELDSINFPIQNVQVIFKAWSNYMTSVSYSHDLVVGVCAAPGDFASFTPVDTIQLTGSPLEYEVSFESVPGAGKYVSFFSYRITNTSASYNYAYIDSIGLEIIPACQAPNNLHATLAQTYSADLAWNDRTGATEWQVEYGPRGFVPGTGAGTRVSAYTNPHTISGLLPAVDYDFYVRAVCSMGDTSAWSRTPGQFTTLQNPATAPYVWNCEDAAEWANWQTSSNKRTITWYRGTAAGNGTNTVTGSDTCAIYISTDAGATFGTNADDSVVNAAAYRDIDFGPDGHSWQFTFRARVGGTAGMGYDGLLALIVDPSIPVTASDANITSPWGDVRDISSLNNIHYSPNWNTYTAVLDNLTGIHRIAFFWFNQGTNSLYPFRGGAAAVDDISIQQIDCPRPCNILASNVTMSTADISWVGEPNSTYYISCRSLDDASIFFTDTVSDPFHHLSGLTPSSRYQITIVRRCDSASTSTQSLAYVFSTLVCNGAILDTIGDQLSTTTSSFLPANNYYRYTYTQQIVAAEELGGAGEISSISFNYGYSSATNKSNCTIYMGHTTLSSFASADDFVSINSLQPVYVGSINPSSAGWFEVSFTEPFSYNGTDNIVIAIDDNSGTYTSTSNVYNVAAAPATMAISYFSDSENPNPLADSLLRNFEGEKSVYAYRNLMAISLCPPNTCLPPTLVEPRIRPDYVTLRWRNTSDRYVVSYRRAVTSSWIVDNLQVEDTFYTIRNLYPNTDYVYRVRQYCDSTGVSNWITGTFNSNDIPCIPPDSIWVTSLAHNKASLKWTSDGNYSSYTLRIYNTYYDKEYVCALRSKTVTGLQAGVTYYAQVKAVCQGMEEISEYGDPISFTTTTCPDAADLVAIDVQGNTATLDWTPGGDETQWEIQIGYPGFSVDEAVITCIADQHPYTVTGLTGSTDYDVYVRSVCGEDFYGEHWSNRLRITTEYSAIASVTDDCRVRLYPNPTDADVLLSLPAGHSGVQVEVLDLAGRQLQRYQVAAGTETQTLSSSQLSQGAYFVHIVGEEINTVKKLVVR